MIGMIETVSLLIKLNVLNILNIEIFAFYKFNPIISVLGTSYLLTSQNKYAPLTAKSYQHLQSPLVL